MTLTVLGSSSAGNGYLLTTQNKSETLIIELGVPFKEVLQAVGYDLSKIAGAVVTHEHGDHAKAVPEALRRGVKVLGSESLHKTPHPYAIVARPQKSYQVGSFKVFPLEVYHDVPCYSYVITHEEMGRLLFITDTMHFPYTVKGVTHLMIEANYQDELLQEAISNGTTFHGMRGRLEFSHMEFSHTLDVIKRHEATTPLDEVVLLHLSGSHADPRQMREQVQAETGIPTHIAKGGLEIELTEYTA